MKPIDIREFSRGFSGKFPQGFSREFPQGFSREFHQGFPRDFTRKFLPYFPRELQVKKLSQTDLRDIYDLCRENDLYYRYCPPMVTMESLEDDFTALPPGITMDKKYYVGYIDGEELIAVLDLIDGYPCEDTAFIGFFMVKNSLHKGGVGSELISRLCNYLKNLGFDKVRLAWAKGNPQAEHFWIKNGFEPIMETSSTACELVILAERKLIY